MSHSRFQIAQKKRPEGRLVGTSKAFSRVAAVLQYDHPVVGVMRKLP